MNLAAMTGESLDENSPHLGPFNRRTAGRRFGNDRAQRVDALTGFSGELSKRDHSARRRDQTSSSSGRILPARIRDGLPIRDDGLNRLGGLFGLGFGGAAFRNGRALSAGFFHRFFVSLAVSTVPPPIT